MAQKISVIGGAGFIGTNLCQRLQERQIDFEIIDIQESRRFPEQSKIGDVTDLQSLRDTISGDSVVHLAAAHRDDIVDKTQYQRVNVDGAQNVALVCSEKGIKKIVFTSSVAVYGFAPLGTDETGAINPFNDYGKTKYEAEEQLRAWQKAGDNALIIVRPTVVFGEGNRGNVFNLLNQIASRKFIMIGAGQNKKSMAYIGNLVAFLEKTLKTDKTYALYNYVDTPDFDMNTLVGQVRKTLKGQHGVGLRLPYWFGLMLGYLADGFTTISGKKLVINSIRIKKFCSSTAFASAKSELEGFTPPFTLQEGIARTLQSEFIAPDPNREIFYTE